MEMVLPAAKQVEGICFQGQDSLGKASGQARSSPRSALSGERVFFRAYLSKLTEALRSQRAAAICKGTRDQVA